MALVRIVSVLSIALGVHSQANAAKFECRSERGLSPYVFGSSLNHDHDRYAPLERELYRDFGVFVSSFDSDDDDNKDGHPDLLAVPEWVAYELVGLEADRHGIYQEPDISIERPKRWYRDRDLEFLSDVQPFIQITRIDDSYSGIGVIWNRGHLAMADHAQRYGFADARTNPSAADNFNDRVRRSWQASCATHVFFNAVPQAAAMNQGPWLHLENYVAAAANKFGRVWTVAGPIFDPNEPIMYIGDTGEVPVAVPHAVFKVLVVEQNNQVAARGFVFEQRSELVPQLGHVAPTADSRDGWVKCNQAKKIGHTYDHRDRLVPLSEIESRADLTFFSDRIDRERLIDTDHDALWSVEKQFWTGTVCAKQNYLPEDTKT